MSTVEIALSNGGVTLVDADVAERLRGRTVWGFASAGGRRYAALNGTAFGMERTLGLHRFVMWSPTDRQVDHINGDPLDNRRINLRVVTPGENVRSRTNKARGKYGRFIAYWKNRYRVRISKDGRLAHISAHLTLDEAREVARKEAERILGWAPDYSAQPTTQHTKSQETDATGRERMKSAAKIEHE